MIGATNKRERIDDAILSRFGESVEIALPGPPARKGILTDAFREHNLTLDVADEIVGATQGLSGRDLISLARLTRREAAGEGTTPEPRHIRAALTRIRGRASTSVDERATWDTLVLSEALERELRSVVSMLTHAEELARKNLSVPRGILLYGPPGTGKTQIARTMANESGFAFHALSTAELMSGYLGQSPQKVRAAFERARTTSPSVLFIDEIDVLASPRGGSGGQITTELIGQLLQELDGARSDGGSVFVLAATNRLDAVDSAVLSRFPRRVEIGLPDQASRERLLRVLLEGKPLAVPDPPIMISKLAALTDGASGRDLRSFCEQAEQRALQRALDQGDIGAVAIKAEDFWP